MEPRNLLSSFRRQKLYQKAERAKRYVEIVQMAELFIDPIKWELSFEFKATKIGQN